MSLSSSTPPLPAAWRRRITGWLVFLFMLLMAGSVAFGWAVLAHEHFQGVPLNSNHPGGILDYVSFHAAAHMVRESDGAGIYNLDALGEVETQAVGSSISGDHVLPFLNPPFVAVALAPFGGLGLADFVVVLFTLNFFLFLVTAVTVQKLLRLTGLRQRLFFLLFCFSLFPVFALFLQQQLTLWICLAWLGFVSFESKGKHMWSGAALAMGLVKPQMVLLPLLFLIYHRRWRTLASFSAIAAPLVLVSLAVVGPQGLIDYPRLLLDSTAWETNGVNARQMFGWNGIVADLTGDLSPPRLVLLALALPTLALVAWCWRGDWNSQLTRLPGVMALTLTASLLVNPHLYFYDMTLASLALALGAVQSVRSTGSLGAWPLIAGAFWIAALPLPGASYNVGFPLLSLATVALFGVLFASLRSASHEATAVETVAASTRLAA